MCGSKVTVKIDTGAETSVLPLYVYKQLKVKPKVYQSSVNLTSYGGHKLSHIGRSNIECEHRGRSGKLCDKLADKVDKKILIHTVLRLKYDSVAAKKSKSRQEM